jgi:hypothetical protein
VNDLAVAVGFAGMIYVLRAIASVTPVDCPIRVDAADVDPPFVLETARDLVTGDSFAFILRDLAPLFERDGGETASAVNPRMPDFNPWSEVYLFYPAFAQSTDSGR